MKILAIVVTYHPEKELLEKNISAFIEDVDKVLVWENTPESEKFYYRFIYHEKVEYCGDGINSISRALNYAWRYARDNGYEYLLTMDQDSVWKNFKSFLEKTVCNSSVPYGIYGPCINRECNKELYYPKELITSGMLVPISVLNKVDGYNELFRIDGIDTWLCCVANEYGISSYEISGCFLEQRFGGLHKTSFLGHIFFTLDYPSWRLYEIYKSYVIIMRRFKVSHDLKMHFWTVIMWKDLVKILIVEKDKINKFKNIYRGVKDGLLFNL